jgi:D-arabinose 1-dehydrogenase-like Zn-dependent alcohol dehydrogenase
VPILFSTLFSYSKLKMDEIAPEYDVVVLGTGGLTSRTLAYELTIIDNA